MQIKSIRKYLGQLIQDGQKWQYLELNGDGEKPKLYFSSAQFLLLFLAIFSTYLIGKEGLNNNFVGYVISALSIFIGLFLTLILSAFDKFKGLDKIEKPDELDNIYLIQRINFFKQFTSLTTYAIIISLMCILLLSATYLTEFFKLSIFYPEFITYKMGVFHFCSNLFCKTLFASIYNVIVIYFLLNFLLIVVYAVTSIHTYMMIEYKR